MLLHLANASEELLDVTDSLNAVLRHPKLGKPYLAEFLPIKDEVSACFRKEFAYDTFFLSEQSEQLELQRYLEMLIVRAQGRPVLQFCRSTGRIGWMRSHFDAVNLFLWRNPWDQWWSYKVAHYFDTANLLILNARHAPPVFQDVRSAIGFEEFHNDAISDEFSHYDDRSLGDTESYFLFFALWYHAMHEGIRMADAVISIDSLSRSPQYRRQVLDRLGELGVAGLNFCDCSIHQGWFAKSDMAFFQEIEGRVRLLFERHGYDQDTSARIAEMRSGCGDRTSDIAPLRDGEVRSLVEDLERLRKLVRRLESEAAEQKHLIVDLRKEILRLVGIEAELHSIYDSRIWKVVSPVLGVYWTLRSICRKIRDRRHVATDN